MRKRREARREKRCEPQPLTFQQAIQALLSGDQPARPSDQDPKYALGRAWLADPEAQEAGRQISLLANAPVRTQPLLPPSASLPPLF